MFGPGLVVRDVYLLLGVVVFPCADLEFGLTYLWNRLWSAGGAPSWLESSRLRSQDEADFSACEDLLLEVGESGLVATLGSFYCVLEVLL